MRPRAAAAADGVRRGGLALRRHVLPHGVQHLQLLVAAAALRLCAVDALARQPGFVLGGGGCSGVCV
jgi:hypothetical protein